MLALAVAIPILTYFAFSLSGEPAEALVRKALMVCAILQAVVGVISVVSTSRARADARIELNNKMAPLSAMLKYIPTYPSVERQSGVVSFLTFATATCLHLSDAPRMRATYFERFEQNGEVGFRPTGISPGRGDAPESIFKAGDGAEGDVVWKFARSGKGRFVPNIKKMPRGHIDLTRERHYKSFITTPVMVNGEPVGLLTINSPKKKGFKKHDMVAMQIVANLCATAIAGNDGKCPSLPVL